MILTISRLRSNTDTNPILTDIPWPDGFDDFHVTGPSKRDKDASPAWCPASFNGPRKDPNVVALSALVLDYDKDPEDAEDILARWDGYERVLHSTHTPGRYRLILPYARSATPAEHAVAYAAAVAREGERVDPSCANPSRLFYWPTVRTDEEPIFAYVPGAFYPVPVVTTPVTTPVTSPPAPGPYAAVDAPKPLVQDTDEALMESRCAFTQHAHANAASLKEPEWYAYLSLLARCRGGDELAHERSAPHPGYSRAETAFKYARAKTVGPATCAHIRSISTACRGCPLAISTPLQLGRPTTSDDTRPPHATPTDADPHEVVREAERVAEAARLAHTNAVVVVEQTRRRLRTLRTIGTLASEDEISEAVREVEAARNAEAEALRVRKAAEKALVRARKGVSVEGLPSGADPAVWQKLNRGADGVPKPTLANVLTVLRDDPRWASRLAYDTFALDVTLDGKVVPETHATRIAATLAEQYTLDVGSNLVAECVRAAAEDRPFHPVRDWLAGVTWDGVSRIADLMVRGFGALPGEDPELVSMIGVKFLVSIIARVMQPGAKVDTMLVLIGEQGAYKSTSFETLASPAWFSGSKLDIASKDSFLNLRGKLLYELAELESMKRVDASASKQWMSQRVDTYRAPYERRSADHPRQTVMVGSTNEEEFLMDPTGHRRYWPVRVGRADIEWLRENREQLFAEAVALYTSGTTWWFDERSPEAERLRAWASQHVVSHPWTETVQAWLHQRKVVTAFTSVEALSGALMKSVGDITHADKSTMAGVLRHLGCRDVGVDSARGGVRVYAPPESAKENASVVLRDKV